MSPSVKREWIEIYPACGSCYGIRSPSVKREWIEISLDKDINFRSHRVSLCKEGVD